MTYDTKQIAQELYATAIGRVYYGNALRVAKDLPGVSDSDRAVLDRYATGQQCGMDHVRLQDIAIKLRQDAKGKLIMREYIDLIESAQTIINLLIAQTSREFGSSVEGAMMANRLYESQICLKEVENQALRQGIKG